MKRKGFTLVELLVAMAVFSIVVSVATGAFIRALRTQRQLVSFASANSNVSLVLEQIAREVRVGRSFEQTGTDTISFVNGRGQTVVYTYDVGIGAITKTVDNQAAQPLTSENVLIRDLQFVTQYLGDDAYPARITVLVSVSPQEVGIDTSVVRIQSTISARNIGT
jgi:prepilin-type N-terminal cleavage/methylation domain-containing protein